MNYTESLLLSPPSGRSIWMVSSRSVLRRRARSGRYRLPDARESWQRRKRAGPRFAPGRKLRVKSSARDQFRPDQIRKDPALCFSQVKACRAVWVVVHNVDPTARSRPVEPLRSACGQKTNFNANWMSRGLFACDDTCPKLLVPPETKFVPGKPNCG